MIGHGVRSLGVERALSLGQAAAAHAEEYFYAAVRNRADSDEWRRAARFTKASGAYVMDRLTRPVGVMVRGRWFPRAALDSMLACLAASGSARCA